jgi:hypothetical protein
MLSLQGSRKYHLRFFCIDDFRSEKFFDLAGQRQSTYQEGVYYMVGEGIGLAVVQLFGDGELVGPVFVGRCLVAEVVENGEVVALGVGGVALGVDLEAALVVAYMFALIDYDCHYEELHYHEHSDMQLLELDELVHFEVVKLILSQSTAAFDL